MKIGLVMDTTLDSNAGVQQYFKGLARYFIKKGHEISFLVPRSKDQGEFKGKIISFGRSINPIGNVTSVPLAFSLGKAKIKKVLKDQKFDIIHIGAPFSPFLGAKIVDLCKCPVVLTYLIHTKNSLYFTGAKFMGMLLSKVYKKVDARIAISDIARQEAEKTIPGDYQIIPIGVDLGKYSKASKPIPKFSDDKFNILFFSRLEERKGCEYLIRAYKKIEKNSSRLIIAGDGPLRDKLEELVEELKLKNVHFEGYIDEKLKQNYYASSDLCVFPAIYGESFGVVLIEAMAAGKVPIAFANKGYSCVLKNLPELLVPNKDAKKLAAKILKFMKDKDLRKEYEKKCLKEAQKYRWDVVGERVLKIYERLL